MWELTVISPKYPSFCTLQTSLSDMYNTRQRAACSSARVHSPSSAAAKSTSALCCADLSLTPEIIYTSRMNHDYTTYTTHSGGPHGPHRLPEARQGTGWNTLMARCYTVHAPCAIDMDSRACTATMDISKRGELCAQGTFQGFQGSKRRKTEANKAKSAKTRVALTQRT